MNKLLISSLFLINVIAHATTANAAVTDLTENKNNVYSSHFAVDSQSCKSVRGKKEPFILVLKKGEDINESLIKCATDAAFASASLSALGAFEVVTLRYFNHDTKKYVDKDFGKNLEVISMPGNITKLNDNYFAHIHITLADANYQVIGGHLKKARVGATLEITITPMKEKLFRVMNEDIGLNIIRTKNNG